MHVDPKLNYDSTLLRRECIAQDITSGLKGKYSISRAKPGLHNTQKGSFDIETDKIILSVSVWEGGEIEIKVLGKEDAINETHTISDTTIPTAVEKIRSHLLRFQ